MRTTSQNEQPSQTPQEFAKDHWKEILAASGSLAGAVIFLLIKYHKKRSKENGEDTDLYLDIIAKDALLSKRDSVPLMIDTIHEVEGHVPDLEALSQKLSEGLPEEIKGEKSRKRWSNGSPRGLMKTIGLLK